MNVPQKLGSMVFRAAGTMITTLHQKAKYINVSHQMRNQCKPLAGKKKPNHLLKNLPHPQAEAFHQVPFPSLFYLLSES
jgi:hypothetical protein